MITVNTCTPGGFNELGVAEGVVKEDVGKIKTLMLVIHIDSENWAILSEVRYK